MYPIAANLTKQQMIRLGALGASRVSNGSSIIGDAALGAPAWMLIVIRLMEDRAVQCYRALDRQPPGAPVGSWAGDHVVVLRPDDPGNAFVPVDCQALAALADRKLTSYDYVRRHCADVTDAVQAWWERSQAANERIFTHCAAGLRGPNPHPADLRDSLRRARRSGASFCDRYAAWLLDQDWLHPHLRRLTQAVLAGLLRCC